MNKIYNISESDAANWLEGYKSAWIGRDVDLAVSLFTDDAEYKEKRFGEPLLGHPTLRSYWNDRIYEHQRDISFAYQIWSVQENICVAGWQANFTWLPINGIMEMDGVFRMTFAKTDDGKILCTKFDEWMDCQEFR